nr:alpha/beta hydrolase fold [uncultured organism]
MKIYKDYDQQQLDDQYNTRLRVPWYADYLNRWELSSRQANLQHAHVSDLAYGEDPLERLDVFPAPRPDAPVLVFIHGGYWHLLDKSMFDFLATFFVKKNVTTVVVNYPLAPAASLDQMVQSCDLALAWVELNIGTYNGDPKRIFVAGHSAGGQLAAMLLTQDAGIRIKGVLALSGIFRLEPVFLSYVNGAVQMNKETAVRNSPVLLRPVNTCPALVVAGQEESEEFQAQSKELFDCWKGYGQVKHLTISGRNHYSILDALVEEGSELALAWEGVMHGFTGHESR